MKTIDLHIHTTASDGTYTPIELVDYAIEKKLSAVAITDHDTMGGIREAINYIRENQLPLELIPGMEVSASAPGYHWGIHILAFFIDKSDEEIEGIIKNFGAEIQKGFMSPKDAIELIAKYGGLSSLAHPKEYGLSMAGLDKLVGELAPFGLNGVECVYTTHSTREIKQLKEIASRYDLLFTGGTDFHGSWKPGVDLGTGFGHLAIPYEIVDSLKNKLVHCD